MISSPKSLYRAIGIKQGEIATILADMNAYYYEYEKKTQTSKGKLKIRIITPSIRTLKIVQKEFAVY